MTKKVSIIIPCYNQGKYISDSINSALAQTYDNIEIVCVNDGSTDNSSEIIKSYAEKYENIIFLNKTENVGVISARNLAIEKCSGEYILPLDADDTIDSTYVEKAVKIIDSNPNIGIVYCKARLFGCEDKYWHLDKFDKSNILYNNCIFVTALFRKSDFIKVGMYKNYMQNGCEDYDLWLSFIEQGLDVYQIDEILFNYRQYEEDSRSTNVIHNMNKIRSVLIKNHIDLYLKDEQFVEYFSINPIKRKKKYKRKYNLLLLIAILESVLLIVFFALFIGRLYG